MDGSDFLDWPEIQMQGVDGSSIPEHAVPAVGAVHVARMQGAAFQIRELLTRTADDSRSRRNARFRRLSPVRHGSAHAQSLSSTMPLGGQRPCTRSIHRPNKSPYDRYGFSGCPSRNVARQRRSIDARHRGPVCRLRGQSLLSRPAPGI
jgi:hypothetical protein